MEYKRDGDTSYICCTQYTSQKLGKGTSETGNKDHSIVKISYNTEKSSGWDEKISCHSDSRETNSLTLL